MRAQIIFNKNEATFRGMRINCVITSRIRVQYTADTLVHIFHNKLSVNDEVSEILLGIERVSYHSIMDRSP